VPRAKREFVLSTPHTNSVVCAAREYADLGLHVVPLKPDDTPRWKWRHVRAPSAERLEEHFTKFPDDGLAVVVPRGIVVVDLDGVIPDDFIIDTDTVVALTGVKPGRNGRGLHLWYRDYYELDGEPLSYGLRSQTLNRCYRPKQHEGMNRCPCLWGDLKAGTSGAYVKVPPTMHKSGHRYEWIHPFAWEEIAWLPPSVAEAPRRLREARKPSSASDQRVASAEELNAIPEMPVLVRRYSRSDAEGTLILTWAMNRIASARPGTTNDLLCKTAKAVGGYTMTTPISVTEAIELLTDAADLVVADDTRPHLRDRVERAISAGQEEPLSPAKLLRKLRTTATTSADLRPTVRPSIPTPREPLSDAAILAKMSVIEPLDLRLEVTGKGASAAHEVWAVLCRMHPAIEALGHDPDSGMWFSEKIARACAISKGTRWRGLQKLLADGHIYPAQPLIPTKYHRNGVGYAFTNANPTLAAFLGQGAA
jgi:Bifunctional DNA primase/polymerase, N-terminal